MQGKDTEAKPAAWMKLRMSPDVRRHGAESAGPMFWLPRALALDPLACC